MIGNKVSLTTPLEGDNRGDVVRDTPSRSKRDQANVLVGTERRIGKAYQSRLAPLNLLASCSLSNLGEMVRGGWVAREGNRCFPCSKFRRGDSAAVDLGRLGGRSPLSSRMVIKVAQPDVFTSCIPSAGAWVVATRQRRASSSCGEC